MARLPPITGKDQVPANDHPIVDAIAQSRGAIQGPFTMFLHSPELAGRVAHLGAYVRFEGSLDMRVRVLAAMTVAREFEAVYVWGAQTGGARRRGGGGGGRCRGGGVGLDRAGGRGRGARRVSGGATGNAATTELVSRAL